MREIRGSCVLHLHLNQPFLSSRLSVWAMHSSNPVHTNVLEDANDDEEKCAKANFSPFRNERRHHASSQENLFQPNVKILFIGSSGAGKSSLMRALARQLNVYLFEHTGVIDLFEVSVGNCRLQFHDISGHDPFHTTHGFLLSSSLSLIIYVIDTELSQQQMEKDAGYWLSLACSCRLSDDPRANVMLFGSRGGQCKVVNQTKLINLDKILNDKFESVFFHYRPLSLDLQQCDIGDVAIVMQDVFIAAQRCLQFATPVPRFCCEFQENILPQLLDHKHAGDTVLRSPPAAMEKAALYSMLEKASFHLDNYSQFQVLLDYLDNTGQILDEGNYVIVNIPSFCAYLNGRVRVTDYAKATSISIDRFRRSLEANPNGIALSDCTGVHLTHMPINGAVAFNSSEDLVSHGCPGRDECGLFPIVIHDTRPDGVWMRASAVSGMVYVGIRIQCQPNVMFSPVVIPLLQCEVSGWQDDLTSLIWNEGMLIKEVREASQPKVEALVTFSHENRAIRAIDVTVRVPPGFHRDAKQFLSRIQQMTMRIFAKRSPGTRVEKRYLSHEQIKQHADKPISYSQEEVDAAKESDGILISATENGTVQDSVVDLLAVEDDHLIYKLQSLTEYCRRDWLALGCYLLSDTPDEVRRFTASLEDDGAKFCHVTETWMKREGKAATLEELLAACDRVAIGLRRQIEEALETTPSKFSRLHTEDEAGLQPALRHCCTRMVCDGPPARQIARVDGEDDYRTFKQRLDTYRHWPSWAGAKPEDLAQDGFYYTGIRDEVKCYSCGQLLRLWRPSDNIRQRHKKNFPRCPFIRSEEAGGGRMPPLASGEPTYASSYSQGATSLHDMRFEDKRLRTFQEFPVYCPVRPADLARSGFYFTGREDAVQCFSCRIALRGWENGDTADGEHRRHNPFCPFLNGQDHTNVPIQVASSPSTVPIQTQSPPNLQYERNRLATFDNWPSGIPVSTDDLAEAGFYYLGVRDVVCCFQCRVHIEQWVPGDVPVDEHLKHSPDCSFARQVAQRKQPYNRQGAPNAEATADRMKSYEQRLMSFRDWPATAPVTAESLAMAGFYYSGRGDGVRCFSCGGALKGWQWGDTAMEEHAKYFPSCDFVKQHGPVVPQSHDEPWTQPRAEPPNRPDDTTPFNESEFIQQATSMGFSRDVAYRVLRQQNTSNLTFTTYLDALLQAPNEEDKASLPSVSHTTSTGLQPTAPPQTHDVRQELQQLAESRLCKVCMEHEATILFLPCAHILCCEQCSRPLVDCPVCRTRIQQKIRSYFS